MTGTSKVSLGFQRAVIFAGRRYPNFTELLRELSAENSLANNFELKSE